MKAKKAILSLLLIAALLLTLFAACADGEKPDNGNDTVNMQGGMTDSNDSSGTSDGQDEIDASGEEGYDPEDYETLRMFYFDLRMVGEDCGDHMVEAVNAYIGPKYGLQVDVQFITIGDWQTKALLAISSGEAVDLIPIFSMYNIDKLYPSTMLMEIEDYLNEYAPDAMALMGELAETYRRDGGLYGLPTNRGLCTNGYIIMRRDMLEELNLLEKAQNMTTWSEYEEILQAVSERYRDEGVFAVGNSAGASYGLPVGSGALTDGDQFSDIYIYDDLSDAVKQVITDTEGNVSWLMDDPRVEEAYARAASWLKNGWGRPDTAFDVTHGDELLKQGVLFSSIQSSEYGVEVTKSNSSGRELIAVQTYPGMIRTATLTGWGIGVPITAEAPEAACRMINAMYTDETLMNLLVRGVEGVDYEVVDGQVSYQGEHYFYGADWVIGNNLLLTPIAGNGADYYEKISEINNAAPVSKYLGFAVDTSEMDLYIANLNAVNDQYSADMNSGNYTPEAFQEYKAKLEVAGVHDYLNEIQTQLSAWRAQQ